MRRYDDCVTSRRDQQAVVTVLENDSDVPAGHLERVAASRKATLESVRLFAGDPLPDPSQVDVVVVLGGEMGAYDSDTYPYLAREKTFLAEVAALRRPTLGICLGCQLLAEALGGSAYLADTPEYHLGPIEILQEDDVIEPLGSGPSFSLHRDTWVLPPGATLLGRTARFNHAFRLGAAVGVQSHPELTEGTLSVWLSTAEGADLARAAGTAADVIAGEFSSVADATERVATNFFNAWFDHVGM